MNNAFFKFSLLATFFLLVSFTTHKYYLSLTEIEYNQKNKSLEIITNVFIDDIELELNKVYKVDLKLNTPLQYKETNKVFSDYFSKKILLNVDGKECELNYLGIEFEADLVYIYHEVKNITDPKKFECTNKILIQEFEDQQNVVKVKIDKTRRSDILTKENVKAVLNF